MRAATPRARRADVCELVTCGVLVPHFKLPDLLQSAGLSHLPTLLGNSSLSHRHRVFSRHRAKFILISVEKDENEHLRLQYHLGSHAYTTTTMFSLILHACLASLALAAPVATEITTQDITPVGQYGGGVVGFIVLILDILVWSRFSLPSRLCHMDADFLQSNCSNHPAPQATSCCGLFWSSFSPSVVSYCTGSSPTGRSGTRARTGMSRLLRSTGKAETDIIRVPRWSGMLDCVSSRIILSMNDAGRLFEYALRCL